MRPSTGRRSNIVGAWVILGAITVGTVLLGLAMARYPGGTALDPASVGHSFWFNFLCDLTNDRAVNGAPNGVAAGYARAALGVYCVALAAFWMIVPRSLQGPGPAWSWAIRGAGVLSVLGLMAIPFASGTGHVAAVFVSLVPALIAGTLALYGTIRHSGSRVTGTVACATVLVALADGILYARGYLVQPRLISPGLPLLQRLALLLMLLWMGLVAARELRYSTTNR